MKIAVYVRVSTQRQSQMQTIDQQLERLQAHFQTQGWEWQEELVFRDDGYSGASLKRPGLGHFDRVLITTPDRLARKYIYQMLLIEELEKSGCQVEFVERPMSQDPHDQLVLQIRGAVAEYERNLIDSSYATRPPAKVSCRHVASLGTSTLWVSHRPGPSA